MTTHYDSPTVFRAEHIFKQYDGHVALADVGLSLGRGGIVGLIGRNGAGKSTLLHTMAGLTLPTSGECHTFGTRTDLLDTPELTRVGLVMQEPRFVEWMTVELHLAFTASFYPAWDGDLQTRLIRMLEVPLNQRLGELSTGDRQKVAILLGMCHRPALLLLDEPMSSLDPIARRRMLELLLELMGDDDCTVVISSHLLNDIEKVANRIIALDAGRVVLDEGYDELLESYAEWMVTATDGRTLPAFTEPFVLAQQSGGRMARLTVRLAGAPAVEAFASAHGVLVQPRPLNLEEIFSLLLKGREGVA